VVRDVRWHFQRDFDSSVDRHIIASHTGVAGARSVGENTAIAPKIPQQGIDINRRIGLARCDSLRIHVRDLPLAREQRIAERRARSGARLAEAIYELYRLVDSRTMQRPNANSGMAIGGITGQCDLNHINRTFPNNKVKLPSRQQRPCAAIGNLRSLGELTLSRTPKLKDIQLGLDATCSICGDALLTRFCNVETHTLENVQKILDELFKEHIGRKHPPETLNCRSILPAQRPSPNAKTDSL